MCSRTDERSGPAGLSELWPAEPPFKLDEDYQSPGLFSLCWRVLEKSSAAKVLCRPPSCTPLWQSFTHSFSCRILMWLFGRAKVCTPSVRSASWLHEGRLVSDVGLHLSSLPKTRQRQQHYSRLNADTRFVRLDANSKGRALRWSVDL